MPTINRFYSRRDPQNVGTEIVYYERNSALLEIGASGKCIQDCLVDSGAVLSVFPEKEWRRFASEIHWLHPPGSTSSLPEWLVKVTGLGGAAIDCGIGMIAIRIIELPSQRRSPSVPIIAKFPLDQGVYTRILLGLGGQAFVRWKLVIDSAAPAAWLEY
jgi:hypothetical protein